MTLKEELRGCLSEYGGDLAGALNIKGVNDRVDALTMICRDAFRASSLCYIGGDLHRFDGKVYVTCRRRDLLDVLGNVLVDMDVSPTDVRKMGEMPLSVIMEKSYSRNPHLICFGNGIYHLMTGISYGFDASLPVTESLPYRYDPEARCPLWLQFLEEVLPDASMRMVLQEYFGMCYLDRSTMSVEKFAVFIGEGANGKSVIREVVSNVMGPQNVSAYDAQQLTQEKMLPYLNGKRINFASDMKASASFDSALKVLSSGQEVVGRRVYGEPELVKCPPIVFSMNALPRFLDTSYAFFRRVLLFRFGVTIPEGRRDPLLASKICESELPGVFNWMIAGRDRLLANRGVFTRCASMENELSVIADDERVRNSPVLSYLAGRGLSARPLFDGQEPVAVSQAEIVGAVGPQLSKLSITRTMTSLGVKMQRRSDGRYYWVYEIK